MYYSARPALWPNASNVPPGTLGGYIGLALSSDGLHWSKVDRPLLDPNEDWWWFDTTHLTVGSVLLDANQKVRSEGGVYLMYYAGGDMRKATLRLAANTVENVPGVLMNVGLAISKDGEHFTRMEGELPNGAIFDGDMAGGMFVSAPDVVRIEKGNREQYVMHYMTFSEDGSGFKVGRAVSDDAFVFRRDGDADVLGRIENRFAFAERGVRRCRVVPRGNKYVMFVEVVDGQDVHRIAATESRDARNWGNLQLVLGPSKADDAWDAGGVSHPCAVVMEDGSVRLYYVGTSKGGGAAGARGTSIGVAQSVGGDWNKFERIAA